MSVAEPHSCSSKNHLTLLYGFTPHRFSSLHSFMFEVSWGEIGVVVGLTFFVFGRQDLPRAARFAGTQLGRIVGLLQGARARADQFAGNNELKQLQNELRSGLRELDHVKAELAVSMSTRGIMGRELGATVPGVNKQNLLSLQIPMTPSRPTMMTPPSHLDNSAGIVSPSPPISLQRSLPPLNQTVAAVAEAEWLKQGISFRSRAEQGVGLWNSVDQGTSGSAILANLLRETLIFDQHDRVVQEQDLVLQSKLSSIKEKYGQSKKSG
jgi:Sec-independent protein translocase protein TatA